MSRHVRDMGYREGPVLPPSEPPFGMEWEHDPDLDLHKHTWERVLLVGDGKARRKGLETVVRCSFCHAPRCGHSDAPDPCMRRRHHRNDHRYLSDDHKFRSCGGDRCGNILPCPIHCSSCGGDFKTAPPCSRNPVTGDGGHTWSDGLPLTAGV